MFFCFVLQAEFIDAASPDESPQQTDVQYLPTFYGHTQPTPAFYLIESASSYIGYSFTEFWKLSILKPHPPFS